MGLRRLLSHATTALPTTPRPEQDVLGAQHGHGREHFVGAPVRRALQQEMGVDGIDRQLGHLFAVGRQLHSIVEGSQRVQELAGAPERSLAGAGQKVELERIGNPHALEDQEDGGQVDPGDFRNRRLRQALKGVLGVQAETDPGAHPTGAARSLGRLGPANVLDREGFHPGRVGEIARLVFSAIHHVANPVQCHGGFGNVGGENDLAGAPLWFGGKGQHLDLRGERGVEDANHDAIDNVGGSLLAGYGGSDAADILHNVGEMFLYLPPVPVFFQMAFQELVQAFDFFLTGQKHKNVTTVVSIVRFVVYLQRRRQCRIDVVFLIVSRVHGLNGKHPPRNLNGGRTGEERPKGRNLQRRGHDHNLEPR
mmetsp:Transcript_3471/g.9726  ORF Transcript_3471/g.9726 Transcript_3471/m.9726 type:complete len:366 (-) Transcript_3471:131-1228(-)